ncbi:ArgP/LysG family DNA-binding transcriptional regulator [Photobacterium satsumensis]|uniref:ArgP/LysG family DNA-binding transcriptional regulator n=1 Tax=Photobacterium satsumensis TaxID=2910239 RepID=UPI003D138FA6
MLDHREMETLIAIVDGQSFDNAARQLNISPGAVSQRIKSLENRIGHSVLVRSTPPQTTEVGKQVLSYARRMLLLQNELSLALKQDTDRNSLSLAIAVNHDSLSCWFMEVVEGFSDQPQLSFDIRTSNTISTQELLRNGDVIAAITSKANHIGGCKTRYLGQLEYVPVCSPAYFERYFKAGVGKEQLDLAPVAIFDRDDDLVDRFLSLYDVKHKQQRTHYFPSSHVLLDAVKHGLAWTMLPKLLMESRRDKSEIVTFDPQSIFVELYWNTWEQTSEIISKIEKQVLTIADKKLVHSCNVS